MLPFSSLSSFSKPIGYVFSRNQVVVVRSLLGDNSTTTPAGKSTAIR